MKVGDLVRFPTYCSYKADCGTWPEFEIGIIREMYDESNPDPSDTDLVFIMSHGMNWNRYRCEVEVISI